MPFETAKLPLVQITPRQIGHSDADGFRHLPKVSGLGSGLVLQLDGQGGSFWGALSGVSVTSVFGRTGAVVASSGDYSAYYQPLSAKLTNFAALANASGVLTNDGAGNYSWTAAGGGGTVTSVGLSLPSIFTVSGSPVTTSGTLSAALASQSAGLFLASPAASSGAPSMRSIATTDLPATLTQNTTGSAAKLTTARTITATGDASWSVSFDGSANASAALTLATVATAGTVGSSSVVPIPTWDAKGRITGMSSATITPASIGALPASGGSAGKLAKWTSTTALSYGIATDDGDWIYADPGSSAGGRFKARASIGKAQFVGNTAGNWWGIGNYSPGVTRIGECDASGGWLGGAFSLDIQGAASTTGAATFGGLMSANGGAKISTLTGMLKASAGVVSVAAAGSDYILDMVTNRLQWRYDPSDTNYLSIYKQSSGGYQSTFIDQAGGNSEIRLRCDNGSGTFIDSVYCRSATVTINPLLNANGGVDALGLSTFRSVMINIQDRRAYSVLTATAAVAPGYGPDILDITGPAHSLSPAPSGTTYRQYRMPTAAGKSGVVIVLSMGESGPVNAPYLLAFSGESIREKDNGIVVGTDSSPYARWGTIALISDGSGWLAF